MNSAGGGGGGEKKKKKKKKNLQKQNMAVFIKNGSKTTRMKVYNFLKFRLYIKYLQCKFTVLPEMAILIYVFIHRYW